MRTILICLISIIPFFAFSQIRIGNCGKWKYISLSKIDTIAQTCPGDGKSDWKKFSFEPGIPPLHLVVTDTFGNIELVRPFMSANFEDFDPGYYRVYGLYYPFTYYLKKGKNIFRDTMGSYCYGFTENYVLINNNAPDGGEISLVKGNISNLICSTPNSDMSLEFQTNSSFSNYTYILTNENQIVLDIKKEGKFNFNNLISGKYYVHGIAYTGDFLIKIGEILGLKDFSSRCSTKSKNAFEVERKVPFGGEIGTDNTQNSEKYFCTQITNNDTLRLKNSGDKYLKYSYIVLNKENKVQGVEADSFFNLNKYPTGSYKILGISHLDPLINLNGLPLDKLKSLLTCFDFSTNQLSIFIENINIKRFYSGRINRDTIWCVNEPNSFKLNAIGDGNDNLKLIWIATNESGRILNFNPNADSISLSQLEGNLFRFYALAYTGNLSIKIGEFINTSNFSTGCNSLSAEFFTFRKKEAKGGIIRFSYNTQITNICLNPNTNYTIQVFRSNNIGEKYIFLLSNARNEIVSSSVTGQFSILSLNAGTYSIRGLSYTGSLSFGTGSRIDTTIFSNECYQLSENTLNFQKTITDGANISFSNGSNTFITCRGSVTKTFELSNNSNVSQKYAYALTNANGTILQIEKSNTLILKDSSLLIYHIYGIAYSGDLTLKIGDLITTKSLSTGCSSLSKNKLSIIFDNINAGKLVNKKMIECLSPGESKALNIEISDSVGLYSWLVTDSLNKLLEVQNTIKPILKRGQPNNFRIYGFAFTGLPQFQLGKSIFQQNFSIDCYDLTNQFQEVNWSELDGGNIIINGKSSLNICQNGLNTPIEVNSTSQAENDKYVYIITNNQQKIVAISSTSQINLKSFIPGNYIILGLSYSGEFKLKIGDQLSKNNIATYCESWSINEIRIEIIETQIGKIAFKNEKDNVQICSKKSIQSLNLEPILGNAAKKTFVLTNTNGKILEVFNTTKIPNLDQIDDTVIRIYGIGYTGTLKAKKDSIITSSLLSDGCFQLSENFLTINRGNISGGFVSLSNNNQQRQICPSDSLANIVTFRNIAFQGQKFIYLITNTNNILLDTTSSNTYNWWGQSIGEYRVYGFTYNGDFEAKFGDNINNSNLSSDCFGLSSNFISIAKRNPIAGFIVMDDNLTILQNCPNDPDFPSKQIRTIGNISGSQSFVIINEKDIIIDILNNPTIYPTEYQVGKYKVVGISYNGNLTLKKGEIWGANPPSNSCFAITSNEVNFLNIEPKGGQIKLLSGDTSNICIGNNKPINISLKSENSNELTYSYLITNNSNVYLGHFTNTNNLSFEAFREESIRIWGLSHTGSLLISKGDTLQKKIISKGCFELSSNFIPLKLNQFKDHYIKSTLESDSILICTGDGIPNPTTFFSTDTLSSLNYKYVLTTVTNNIISVLNNQTIDLESFGLREMRIYSVAFNGNFIGQSGQSILTNNLSTGCFKLSKNFIKILRDRPLAHRILFSNNDTIQTLCLTKIGSVASLKTSFNGKTGYAYLLLNSQNKVIQISSSSNIELENIPDGNYRVYGLSYTGNLNLKIGNTFSLDFNFASSCFRLSSNNVQFFKGGYAEGGSISAFSSNNTLFSCPADGIADLIDITIPNNPIGTKYQLLVTDSLNRLYYAPIENQLINFNNTPRGLYKIYGIAYTGDLGFRIGSSIFTGSLVNTCYDLSTNFITIYNDKPEAGQITKKDGTTTKTVRTIGSGLKDSIELKSFNVKPIDVPYYYILVNSSNKITSISNGKFYLDTLKLGNYKIYGLGSTNPSINIATGKNFSEINKSENCLIISSNFLEIEVINSTSFQTSNSLSIINENTSPFIFSYFPNPVIETLHVQIQNIENIRELSKLKLIHISGKVIFEMNTSITKDVQVIPISMKNLAGGLYILTLESDGHIYSGKIIKTE